MWSILRLMQTSDWKSVVFFYAVDQNLFVAVRRILDVICYDIFVHAVFAKQVISRCYAIMCTYLKCWHGMNNMHVIIVNMCYITLLI